MFAHRSFLDAGVPVAGSSDYPCGPGEPLAAITSCVERRSLDGELIGGSQRISVAEARALYTTGSAYASGEEHRKGTLAPGMLADFVELSDDRSTLHRPRSHTCRSAPRGSEPSASTSPRWPQSTEPAVAGPLYGPRR